MLCVLTQVRQDVFTAGQNQERQAKNTRQETHAAPDIWRSDQGQPAASLR